MDVDEQALDHVRAVADAVLYEGYLLYPYRASAVKNQVRWQFGVLVPPSYEDTGTGEHASCRTECLAEAEPGSELSVRVRFLQAQRRTVEAAVPGGYREVDSLPVGDEELVAWDEAVEREHEIRLPVDGLLDIERTVPIVVPGSEHQESVAHGRIMRRRQPLAAELRCRAEALPGLVRIRVVVANTSRVDSSTFTRPEALRHSLIGAHVVVSLRGGRFLSQLDPPRWAEKHAKSCVNEHMWPVLVGTPGSRQAMLSCPIILYDYPKVDPSSQGDFFDACEIDELLTLSTLALTDAEKREARATDERARQLVDRVHELPEQRRESMHGRVVVGGREIGLGSRVVLRPARNGDAQDMFVAGRVATVREVLVDVDDVSYVAVTVEGDPASEWQLVQGRYRYFTLDEVELCPDGQEP